MTVFRAFLFSSLIFVLCVPFATHVDIDAGLAAKFNALRILLLSAALMLLLRCTLFRFSSDDVWRLLYIDRKDIVVL